MYVKICLSCKKGGEDYRLAICFLSVVRHMWDMYNSWWLSSVLCIMCSVQHKWGCDRTREFLRGYLPLVLCALCKWLLDRLVMNDVKEWGQGMLEAPCGTKINPALYPHIDTGDIIKDWGLIKRGFLSDCRHFSDLQPAKNTLFAVAVMVLHVHWAHLHC